VTVVAIGRFQFVNAERYMLKEVSVPMPGGAHNHEVA
jgi:hypothetical protein